MNRLEQMDTDLVALQELSQRGSEGLAAATKQFMADHGALGRSHKDALFARATDRFKQGELYAAEQLSRVILQSDSKDIKSLHLLAAVATRLGHHEDAVQLLLDCLDISPNLPFLRYELASALFKSGTFQMVLGLCDELLAYEPGNTEYEALRAAALVKLGRYGDAITQYEQILSGNPDDADILLRYGIALQIVGRTHEAIETFRKVIDRQANNGEAYWNLANLKTYKFDEADVAAMRTALEADSVDTLGRAHLLLALGAALDDRRQFNEAFRTYAEANELAKGLVKYDPKNTTELVDRCRRVFTRQYFESHKEACDADDPIFIVGLPRSGSTLLEQVLSSHSAIDATMELAEIAAMVRSLNNPNRTGKDAQFPGILKQLEADELRRLGEEYLKRTRSFRGNKHFFIDKAPHNFLHIGLIASILPKARIIDTRRNPFACGMSIYKQYFARGTGYAYDLEHIGLYYRDYLRLMKHWHDVLPGRILTVQYEDMVNDMEGQVRKVLDYCGLEFEPQCLEFYKSKRAVATVSSEQVRQPVYHSALEQWRNYEPFLAPLKDAIGQT